MSHRKLNWPAAQFGPHYDDLAKIYDVVRETGMPNACGARLTLPTELNIPAWEKYLRGKDELLLAYIKFGFPLGYVGPVSDTVRTDNHPSARAYPAQVRRFIQKEMDLGGIVGPFKSPPFVGWAHVSPIMTRPLPSVDAVVHAIQEIGNSAVMCTLDVSRAYTNFKSCPLDWPLLNIQWNYEYYKDLTMPFGARASSSHMQRGADVIVSILSEKGIRCYMYLDDIIIIADSHEQALAHYQDARALLHEFGLPEALDKAQPASHQVKWLGIEIDAKKGILSVPKEKLDDAIGMVNKYLHRRAVTRKQLQSILGKLLHIAKCIKPARVFVACLLEALRGAPRIFINIDSSMRSDLLWFRDFAVSWNGVSVFTEHIPTREILVDACLTGIGGASARHAYLCQVASQSDPVHNISELEAINVAVALQTLVSESDKGKCISVICDNMPTVHLMQSGRGHNRVMLEAARAAWMVQAMHQIKLVFVHIPGKMNVFADSLSRAHSSKTHADIVQNIVLANNMTMVDPCLYLLTIVSNQLLCRSGTPVAGCRGPGSTAHGEGSRDQREPALGSDSVLPILSRPQDSIQDTSAVQHMYVHRSPQWTGPRPADGQEPYRPHQDSPETGRCSPSGRSPPRYHRGHNEAQRLCSTGEATHMKRDPPVPDIQLAGDERARGHTSRYPNDVLRGPQAVQGRPPISSSVRPLTPLDEGRRGRKQGWSKHNDQGCEEQTKIGPKENNNCPSGSPEREVLRKQYLPKGVMNVVNSQLPSSSGIW